MDMRNEAKTPFVTILLKRQFERVSDACRKFFYKQKSYSFPIAESLRKNRKTWLRKKFTC